MANSSPQDKISLISKGLYRILSQVVGTERTVRLRRQKRDAKDNFVNCDMYYNVHIITSGSMSEGFNFKSSDLDTVCLDKNAFVNKNTNCLFLHFLKLSSLFCIDNEMCSPGSTLLRCLTCDRNNLRVFNYLVRKGDYMYLSSKAIREAFLSSNITEVHGPCQSDNLIGIKSDRLYALRCPVWPDEAKSFVFRSVQKGWPSYDVLKDICNDGCLFVPVNSKHQKCSDLMDLEWRISFSLAEKKIIYSMNHCQFLCYGLAKLFLNEVLKDCTPEDDLLCSYFMKTAVFWELSDGSHDWSVKTLLCKFWNVFRRLIKWINDGYCPNFFIPENNLFCGKICGENQRMLLSALRNLYSDGYNCLLRCRSLNKNLKVILRRPQISKKLSYHEEEYMSTTYFERQQLAAVFVFYSEIPIKDVARILTLLNNTLNINTESEGTTCAKKLRVNFILQKYAENILESRDNYFNNRKHYQKIKLAKELLLRRKTFCCMNYFYYAIYYFKFGNYHKTTDILHYIMHRLKSKPYMYTWSLDNEIIMATRQQGMTYDTLIKSFIGSCVKMNEYTSIDELKLECRANRKQTGTGMIYVPPLVFMNFLLILSHTRSGEYHRRDAILEELVTLLHHDENYHVPNCYRAISWEILGICEQICGDNVAAFMSYINALDEINNFKNATEARINSLHKSIDSLCIIHV